MYGIRGRQALTRLRPRPWSGSVAELTATATCSAFRAVEETTGEVVPKRLLIQRVEFLAALAQELTATVVAAHWNDTDLATVQAGVGLDGRPLPSKGWMATRRLGWGADTPEGIYVSDRVRRVAEEAAIRLLRLAVHRRGIILAILATWPADPWRRTDAEWAALRGRLPAGVVDAEIRNRTRQVRAFKADHDGRLPSCLTELEQSPRVAWQLLLAAADKQLVTIGRTEPDVAVLRVQLPTKPRPASPSDWSWHAFRVRLPVTVPDAAMVCAPTLRVVDGQIRVDLPWRIPAPSVPSAGYTVALGLDWGVNTLLTGALGKLSNTSSGVRVITDGRRLRFAATAVSAKLQRLRGNREQVAVRRDHYARLVNNLPEAALDRATLTAKQMVLDLEHERIRARIRRLNHALAWAAARWAVDQAQALGATAIFVEDLATLQARGRRRGNARLSGQVRGSVMDAIRHLAAKAGIVTVTVPARGTSRFCPRCGKALRHAPAPDRIREQGWKWAVCRGCGLRSDRDHAAAERIVARGLLGQAQLLTNPNTGQRTIIRTIDGNAARARRRTRAARRADRALAVGRSTNAKTRPGNRRPAPRRSKTKPAAKTPHRVPDRRAVPAPAIRLVAGKRPAGPEPQTRPRLRVAAWSGLAHDCPPPSGHHRPGAACGFHRMVRATEVLSLGSFGPPTIRPRLTRHP
jgi:Putative transposase DNA-binding domain